MKQTCAKWVPRLRLFRCTIIRCRHNERTLILLIDSAGVQLRSIRVFRHANTGNQMSRAQLWRSFFDRGRERNIISVHRLTAFAVIQHSRRAEACTSLAGLQSSPIAFAIAHDGSIAQWKRAHTYPRKKESRRQSLFVARPGARNHFHRSSFAGKDYGESVKRGGGPRRNGPIELLRSWKLFLSWFLRLIRSAGLCFLFTALVMCRTAIILDPRKRGVSIGLFVMIRVAKRARDQDFLSR